MPDFNINQNGVQKLLKGVKPHKAAGPDEISARILKETAHQIAPALTLVFQASLEQSTIPTDWKTAHVAPIYKKGNRSLAANYRPVSLTCISCKLLEHIVSSNIMNHLEHQGILTDAQHGFRRKRSCESQLILTVQDLAKGIEDKQQVDVILLDFSKAFDKVPHRRLLQKLEFYGVRGRVLSWIGHFLSERTQKVVLDGQFSEATPVNSGVPQGTVIGPLLFLVFINDLPSKVKSSSVRLFADDCILYKSIHNPEDGDSLQADLDSLQEWEKTWLMSFHPDKCQLLRVTNKRTIIPNEYTIHGKTLQQVDQAKYLGINIQSKISWSSHVASTARKADGTRAFLQRNMRTCPKPIREQFYNSLVRPIMEYASPVWDPALKKDIDSLEMVQRRAARFVCQDFRRESSVTQMMTSLGWESLASRRAKSRLYLLYKAAHGLVAIPVDNYLRTLASNTRGSDMKYFVPYCRTNTMKYSFFPAAARMWNSLPPACTSAPSFEAFEQSLEGRVLM